MSSQQRWLIGTLAVLALASTYVFQRMEVTFFLDTVPVSANIAFTLNRIIRLIINDLACIALIRVLFLEPRYERLAIAVFLTELLVVLPLYLAVKLTLEGPTEISSPALAQVHRMIVNPLLMFLLIIGLFYERLRGMPGNNGK
jgi:hypothetical protein